jgi:hypothetical protein
VLITDTSWDSHGLQAEKSKVQQRVQQRPHYLTRSASSSCVSNSDNRATNGYCAEFGTKRSQVQILSPRPLSGLVNSGISPVVPELSTRREGLTE